jgi:hypothetical protein
MNNSNLFYKTIITALTHAKVRNHNYSENCLLCTVIDDVFEMCCTCGDMKEQHDADNCVVTSCDCKKFVGIEGFID